MSGGTRVEFASAEPAVYAQRLDEWRRTVASIKLKSIGYRVAGVLPEFLNRELGYCFPTDADLAQKLNTSERNIGKGMAVLDNAKLIDRQTRVKRDDKGEAIGRLRRIFLTMPPRARSVTVTRVSRDKRDAEKEVHNLDTPGGERNTSAEVNGTEVNGTPEVNGTNRVSERNNGVGITPDRITPDTLKGSGGERLSLTREREVKGYFPPNPFKAPKAFSEDAAFMTAFDHFVLELTKGEIGAGELERITQQAFDLATESDEYFMPADWRTIPIIDGGSAADWFRHRAAGLAHRRMAA